MPDANADDTEGVDGFTRSELNAFRVTSVLAGVLLNLIVLILIPRLVAPLLELPEAVWFGLGVGLLGVSLYPLLKMEARLERPPRVLSWQRYIMGCVIGSLVSALLHALLQT